MSSTYVEESIFVHVSKHMYDVSCTEGQLSLNTAGETEADNEQKLQLHLVFRKYIMHVQV